MSTTATPSTRARVQFLSDALADKIIAEARRLLCTKGVTLHHDVLLSRFADCGCKTDRTKKHVWFTEDIIDKCIRSAPHAIKLWNIAGTDPACTLEGDSVHYTPGSAALNMVDIGSNKMRRVSINDLTAYAKVVGQLEHINYSSTAIVPSDVPPSIGDSIRLYTLMRATTRPIVTGAFTIAGFDIMRDLQLAVRGSREALAAKPFAIFSCCPTSPFKWSDVTADNTMKAAELGIPVEFISMPLPGLVAPVTLIGSVIQHTVETLSGVIISQTSKPGAPVIYGGSPGSFDMRSMAVLISSIEAQMIDCAYTQIGKRLGLPTQAYIGLADSKALDAQAGFESGTGIYLASLAGINSLSGMGMLCFESAFSLEKLVFDNQVCGSARRLIAGIAQSETFPCDEIFDQLLATRNLLDSEHTVAHFRSEHFMPGQPIDRSQPDSEESLTMLPVRANKEVKRLIDSYKPPAVLSADQMKSLDKVMTDAGGAEVIGRVKAAIKG